MTPLVLAVDARNPGEFLAVCGLLELVSCSDRATTAAWTRRVGMVHEVKAAASDVCEIRTTLHEPTLAADLAEALGHRAAWKAVTKAGRVPLSDAIAMWAAGIEFSYKGLIVVDYWYERAFVERGRVVQKLGTRDGKGRWKFWAGQQDSKKGITGLLLDLVDATTSMGRPARLQDFMSYDAPGAARLNLDAATTRSSLDRGMSANDAAAHGEFAGRPALELLAAIGISSFFPPRRHGNVAPDGTVGIAGRRFRYCTWGTHAPLNVARLLARGANIAGFDSEEREASIGMMGQYSYLRYARPSGLAEAYDASDEVADEGTNG